jgi:hypothetical protein
MRASRKVEAQCSELQDLALQNSSNFSPTILKAMYDLEVHFTAEEEITLRWRKIEVRHLRPPWTLADGG